MKRLLAVALLGLAVAGASAQTLRWAAAGDPQTMDPHSQNESLTNAMNGQVYEYLVGRDKELNIVPELATEWQQTSPTQWRLKLRPNVKFHDGSAFTADDVVFSINRAKAPTSLIRVYADAVGEPKKIDPLTVEFNLPQVNPIFLQHVERAVHHEHGVVRAAQGRRSRTTSAARSRATPRCNANGTGPYMLVLARARREDGATSATRTGGASSRATCRTWSTRRSRRTRRASPR